MILLISLNKIKTMEKKTFTSKYHLILMKVVNFSHLIIIKWCCFKVTWQKLTGATTDILHAFHTQTGISTKQKDNLWIAWVVWTDYLVILCDPRFSMEILLHDKLCLSLNKNFLVMKQPLYYAKQNLIQKNLI